MPNSSGEGGGQDRATEAQCEKCFSESGVRHMSGCQLVYRSTFCCYNKIPKVGYLLKKDKLPSTQF